MRYKPVLNPKSPWLIWCNQGQAARFEPKANVAVISIKEPEDDFLLPEGFLDALKLEFHDATPNDGEFFNEWDERSSRWGKVKIKLFDEDMANQVMAFLEKHKENNILVHCRAGFSRSAAVASFAAELLGREPVGWATPTTQFLNFHVRSLLNRLLWF